MSIIQNDKGKEWCQQKQARIVDIVLQCVREATKNKMRRVRVLKQVILFGLDVLQQVYRADFKQWSAFLVLLRNDSILSENEKLEEKVRKVFEGNWLRSLIESGSVLESFMNFMDSSKLYVCQFAFAVRLTYTVLFACM